MEPGPHEEPRVHEPRPAETHAAEPRPAEPRPAEPRTAAMLRAVPRTTEMLAAEPRPAEPRTAAMPVPQPLAGRTPEPAFGPPAAPRQDLPVEDMRPTCTVAQLRRFIKSRPWIPMHELRRRFGIDGGDDDVSPMRVGEHTLFIGLPPVEGRLMAELLGGGDVGYELSLDPVTPIVVGVYPMRPVPRG